MLRAADAMLRYARVLPVAIAFFITPLMLPPGFYYAISLSFQRAVCCTIFFDYCAALIDIMPSSMRARRQSP